ncbi:MAG: molybdate ABC transporter substrate-binding protein [Deltaproteobacteria bacterium]|nr:molybdate ABC transporter substrate-binding protein [Deltaproteobacteria bacterium]
MDNRLSLIRKVFLVSITLFTLIFGGSATGFSADLLLFAGAGLRQPTDRLIEAFQKETGQTVRVTYAGSGQLMSSILASGQGDLFMPGSLFYIEKLEKMGRIDSFKKVVAHTAVLAVNIRKTNLVRAFDDLARPGLRLALGDPKAMAFGRTALTILSHSPLKDAILKNVVVYGATVKQLAMYVSQGDVDASIIGRADAYQFRDSIQMISVPPDYFEPETIAVAVLKDSEHREAASRFRDFVASKQGIAMFEHFGFLPLAERGGQGARP